MIFLFHSVSFVLLSHTQGLGVMVVKLHILFFALSPDLDLFCDSSVAHQGESVKRNLLLNLQTLTMVPRLPCGNSTT